MSDHRVGNRRRVPACEGHDMAVSLKLGGDKELLVRSD
jgi:hypothetical protein